MPSVSKKQHDAMEAAAHGHSTLGIPKKIGQEFVAADKAKGKRPAAQRADKMAFGMAKVGMKKKK